MDFFPLDGNAIWQFALCWLKFLLGFFIQTKDCGRGHFQNQEKDGIWFHANRDDINFGNQIGITPSLMDCSFSVVHNLKSSATVLAVTVPWEPSTTGGFKIAHFYNSRGYHPALQKCKLRLRFYGTCLGWPNQWEEEVLMFWEVSVDRTFFFLEYS